jgi:hypothetical protein
LIRRALAACALAALLSATALHAAADAACDAEAEARARSAALAQLFASQASSQKSVVAANGMRVAEQGSTDVVVAHIDADGRVVLGCVDSERAARAFFAAHPAPKEKE